ncbi:MAG: M28 family metallopeptidase [Acidobacteriota bacterium]|nr:M28 family metallopeptidase [Acidobacteriota bacterium]
MRWESLIAATCCAGSFAVAVIAQEPATPAAVQPAAQPPSPPDPIKTMVDRLDLEKYRATIKGLTQFGDRRQGTDRNRAAIDWIEAQLKGSGCTNAERLTYTYPSPGASDPDAPARGAGGGRGRGTGEPAVSSETRRAREGGSSQFGTRSRTGVYQPDAPGAAPLDSRLRALNAQPTTPGERQDVYCTKIGTTHPEEMYIVGGHMDGHGWGEAANDDGSGTALVMELARVFSAPDVQTDRSIRFVLWNNEETGLNGAWAYVNQRKDRQGKEDPAGSSRYPEPKWLGMIQHDMMMWDHGMPGPDGKVSAEQRREADVNIEFQMNSKMAEASQKLAWAVKAANDKYATDYPASVGPHMTNTDSTPFMNLVPAVSLRENERGMQIGAGWDPNWHQPSDVFATYGDKDFRLGLNAAQTTLSAIAQLTGATLKK